MGKITQNDESGAGLIRTLDGEALDSMLVVGEAPWHFATNKEMINLQAKGTMIDSKQLNTLAGLDWEVEQLPASAVLRPTFTGLPTDAYNVRTDKNLVIGRVKSGYHVFQNSEAPIFMDSLLDSGEIKWETAGSLHGGSRVWWLAKLPEDILIGGDKAERVETYLLLMNSHDGSVSITVSITPIRVVCQNTLGYALRHASRSTLIRHTKNAPIKFGEARRALELSFAYTAELAEIADRMVQVSFSDDEFQSFLDTLVPVPEPNVIPGPKGPKVTNSPTITMAKKRQEQVRKIYFDHPTQQNIKGTLWGAVQGVQFFADHIAPALVKSTDDNKFKRVVGGRNLGTEAFDHALTLV